MRKRYRYDDSRWFTWEPGGQRQVTLTPWGREVLQRNVIPAAHREQFVREYRHFISVRDGGHPASEAS